MAPKENRAQTVLAAVARALKAKRPQEAARELAEGISRRTFAPNSDLNATLTAALGKTGTLQLIHGFSTYPCFFCQRGLLKCDHCRARGLSGDRVCGACLGLGITRCDYCDGAGWATYNFVPSSLRPAVLMERARLALRELNSLLGQPVPDGRRGAIAPLRKQVAQRIIQLNRMAGILENALDISKKISSNSPAMKKLRSQVGQTAESAWKKIRLREQGLLETLANISSREESAATNQRDLLLAQRRQSYYEMIAASKNFEGTPLAHPFLASIKRVRSLRQP